MNIRVTGQTQVNHAIGNLRRQASEAARFQDQISTGLKVRAASDNPAAFVTLSYAKAFSRRASTYQETLNDATSDLNAGVATLIDANNILSKARTLAQEGANSATGPVEYEALATEVDSLIDQMIDTANRQNDGRYLFSGTAEHTPPFSVTSIGADGKPTAVGYGGSAERAGGKIGPSQLVDTRYAGGEVFQSTGADAFAVLLALRDDLRNTTLPSGSKAKALSDRITDLDAAMAHIGQTVGEQSAALAGMEAVQSRLADMKLNADIRAGELESTDYAEAVVKMKEQEATFQATLGVTSRLLTPSLLDFLR
jgi:flagellar hook-associated protein 3 FlgL